jgi:hypothetical protein
MLNDIFQHVVDNSLILRLEGQARISERYNRKNTTIISSTVPSIRPEAGDEDGRPLIYLTRTDIGW